MPCCLHTALSFFVTVITSCVTVLWNDLRQRSAGPKFVVDDFVAFGRDVYLVEPASQEEWADVQRELVLQQVGCGKLAAVSFPIAGEERPALLILAFGERPDRVVIVAFEIG